MKNLILFFFFQTFGLAQNFEIKINGKNYSNDHVAEIFIPGRQRTLNIEISSSSKVEFLLENQETNWISIFGKSVFSYNDLPGGFYILKIRKNQKLVSQIKINVALPFFRKWYFLGFIYLFGAMILGIIIYFFLLYKFRQQAKLQKVRYNIASDLHDEVGSTLSSIAFNSNLLSRKIDSSNPEISSMLKQIRKDSEDSIQVIRDTVWSINPNNDSFIETVEKVRSFSFKILTAKEIELNFINDISKPEGINLNMTTRHNLFMIIREAINNLAKHAQAKTATIHISKQKDTLLILIKDDGIGFDTSLISEGNGLKNFQNRASTGGITLDIMSKINHGTYITIKILV